MGECLFLDFSEGTWSGRAQGTTGFPSPTADGLENLHILLENWEPQSKETEEWCTEDKAGCTTTLHAHRSRDSQHNSHPLSAMRFTTGLWSEVFASQSWSPHSAPSSQQSVACLRSPKETRFFHQVDSRTSADNVLDCATQLHPTNHQHQVGRCPRMNPACCMMTSSTETGGLEASKLLYGSVDTAHPSV